jgi:heme a synthase
MTRSEQNPWLHALAVFTAFSTLLLISIGGLVTSHGVGMAVPDWPTTYGYNMFLFPVSQWVGGIFYEHSHRLVASFVGLLTTVLAVWLWMKESRRWLRWLGVAAFLGVSIQGLLGGLRVTLFKEELGIFHATLAQLFLVTIALIALFTSRAWQRLRPERTPVPRTIAHGILLVSCLILAQLVLGATMRHQHAGLAVPDFPLAYGKVWPPTDPEFLHAANQQRVDFRDFKPVTAFHIHLHMAHRVLAVLILGAVALMAWRIWRQMGISSGLTRWGFAWLGLIGVQAVLGAITVLSNKAADIATAHVVVGALSLLAGAISGAVALRLADPRPARVPGSVRAAALEGNFRASPQRL